MNETAVWEKYARFFIAEETDVFASDERELAFYRKLRKEYCGDCLEIGAGYGRLAKSLLHESATVALEPSRGMLSGWSAGDIKLASRVRGTGQMLPFADSSFSLAVFPYNGIHCILDSGERKKVLSEVFRTLNPGGRFAIEICHLFCIRPEEQAVDRYIHTLRDGRTLCLTETVTRDVDQRTITYDMIYTGMDDSPEKVLLVLALIEKDEFIKDLENAGFVCLHVWGDYDCSAFRGGNSPRLLVVAGKEDA